MKLSDTVRGVKSGLTVLILLGGTIFFWSGRAEATTGHFLHGFGTVNQSMGGAGTGAFLDTIGTINLNPAGTIDFDGGRMDFSLELSHPRPTVSSSAQAGAFPLPPPMPAMPPFAMSGSTDSDSINKLIPSFGYVWHRPGTNTALHIGFNGVGGGAVDYPADTTFTPGSNVIMTPQPDAGGLGFGGMTFDYQISKFFIGNSFRLSNRLAVGYSVVPAFQRMKISFATIAGRDDANGSGFYTYPAANKLATSTGIGLQLGMRYLMNDRLTLGMSAASPEWMGKFRWNSVDELGNPRKLVFDLDIPGFVSAGAGYKLSDTSLLALDARWINYGDTRGFHKAGFNPDGSIRGFGWEDIWVLAAGVQRTVNDRLKLRFGYTYSQNPVPGDLSFFSVPGPGIIKSHASAGLSYTLKNGNDVNLGYYHAFEESDSGTYWIPGMNRVPGTRVENTIKEDSFSIGYTYRF